MPAVWEGVDLWFTRFEKMLINKTRMTDHVSCATRFGYISSAICLEGIHTLAHLPILVQRNREARPT
jgi:hypothetical protein